MRSVLLSAMTILTASSGAAAHIEEFQVEVADWFLTGATLQPGGMSHIDAEGHEGHLTSSGLLGPVADDGEPATIQYLLEGHIHGEIEEGQVFLVEYAFDPQFDAGSIAIVGGQLSVEALLEDGSLFGTGPLAPGSPFRGSFLTSALEHLGGPIIANHDANEADFILAINFAWSGGPAPAGMLTMTGQVNITPVPAPAAWGVGALAAAALARRRRAR